MVGMRNHTYPREQKISSVDQVDELDHWGAAQAGYNIITAEDTAEQATREGISAGFSTAGAVSFALAGGSIAAPPRDPSPGRRGRIARRLGGRIRGKLVDWRRSLGRLNGLLCSRVPDSNVHTCAIGLATSRHVWILDNIILDPVCAFGRHWRIHIQRRRRGSNIHSRDVLPSSSNFPTCEL